MKAADTGVASVKLTTEDKMQAGLLKLSMTLKRDPSLAMESVIDEIVKAYLLDRAKFVEYVASHREMITVTVKGSTR
jgi:hypothetical protein